MAQLSNDCFAFGGELLPIEAARALIVERLNPVTALEPVGLEAADGRILATDIVAPLALPPFDNSAVDGYAVRFSDLEPNVPATLPVLGRLTAGMPAPAASEAPGAVRIFTGAPMPPGFDTVFMQEDVSVAADGAVVLPSGLKRGANRRLAGEDIARGAPALPAGRRIGPAEIALLAAFGVPAVPVRARLRVGLFSTGDEVVSPGEPLRDGQLYDANRSLLRALLVRRGAAVTDLGILPDRRGAVAAALAEAAAEHDLLLTSGGVSTGDEDHVRAAVEETGALTFWRLAIKPGRPVAMGVTQGTPIIGLPGNPVAAFVTFVQIARPLVARLAGEVFVPPLAMPVRANFTYRKKEGRREYVRVRLISGAAGLEVAKHPAEGAGIITSLTETDGLVELREDVTRVEPGAMVGFLPYAGLI